jgi:peptidoglycan/xylan/chitin deacetylase (PgdA/CDA1 family)
MTFLAVNYHYISSTAPVEPRAIYPVPVDVFERQLAELARGFEPVSRDQVAAAVGGGPSLPERAFIVTFDDGLREQFELALPVLDRLGVPALFLIPGRPFAERRALYVHKVHHLRETLGDERLLDLLLGLGLDPGGVSDEEAQAAYAYDTADAARLKFFLNVTIPSSQREEALERVLAMIGETEEEFCARLYMSEEQVAKLDREHGAVGSHGYAHVPLATLGAAGIRDDLEHGAALLERVTGTRPRVLSYPHGSERAVSRTVAEQASAAGFLVGFTMERAFNVTLEDPLLLARIDTNDAPGGKRPLFAIDGDSPLADEGMAPARTRYTDEAADPALRTLERRGQAP